MNGTPELAAALKELQQFFDQHTLRHCLIGGLAAIRWGEPRFTQDVDVVVSAKMGDEERIIDALLGAFPTRLKKAEARQFALDHRVLLLMSHSGVPIDISLGALAFEEQMLSRARRLTVVRGTRFRLASPEDVIVMKTVAGRPGDWRDIEGIVTKQSGKLNWTYIHTWLDPLLETLEAPQRASQLGTLRQRIESEVSQGGRSRKKKKRPSKKRGES